MAKPSVGSWTTNQPVASTGMRKREAWRQPVGTGAPILVKAKAIDAWRNFILKDLTKGPKLFNQVSISITTCQLISA